MGRKYLALALIISVLLSMFPANALAAGQADLTLSVTDGFASVVAGANVTYSVDVNNTGPDTATGVIITATVPANAYFNAGASTAGIVSTPDINSGSTLTYTVGALNLGASANVTITFTVVKPLPAGVSQIAFTASVAGDGVAADPNPANNTASDTTHINGTADLGVSVSDSPDPVTVGGDIIYTIALENVGSDVAPDVSLTIPAPSGTTFVSCTIPSGFTGTAPAVGAGGTVTITSASMAAGAAATITLVLRVDSSVAPGTHITLTATAATSDADSNSANDSGTTTTTVVSANSAPVVASGMGSQSGTARTAASTGTPAAVPYTADVSGWFTDADADTLTYSVVSAVDGTSADVSGGVTLTGHTLAYTPAASQAAGSVTILVKANDGEADSTGNVTVTVAVSNVPESEKTVSLYQNGRVKLTPDAPGGQWGYDAAMVKLEVNPDGSATVTGLKAGATTVLYTTQDSVVRYALTINPTELPSTGQNYAAVYWLAAMALLAAMAALLIRLTARKKV